MTVIKPAPIAAKIRGSVPLTALLPRGALEAFRASIDESRDGPPISERAKGFLAHYMVVCKAGWSLLSEPAFDSLARQHERLENEFMSGGPPMSPIYDSYSALHTLAEIPVGIGSETPMTVLSRLTAGNIEYRNVHLLASEIAASHLDLYRAKQVDDAVARILHVRSDTEFAVQLTGPFLREMDLFLGRMFRFYGGEYFIVDSPYVLMTAESAWLEYFDRVTDPEGSAPHRPQERGKKASGKKRAEHGSPGAEREARLVKHLRYGAGSTYWPEFIVNAYAAERNGIVVLAGIPDRPETQPQHDDFDESTFEPDRAAGAAPVSPLERLRQKLYAAAETRGTTKRYVDFIRSILDTDFVSPTKDTYLPLFRAFCCFGALTEMGTTLLEEYATMGPASSDESPIIRAIQRGWFSLFEIRRVHLDRSLEVTDLLRRKQFEIVERSATREVGVTDVIAGWVMVDDEGTHRLEGGVVHMRHLLATRVLADVKAARERFRGRGRNSGGQRTLALLVPDVIISMQRWTAIFSGRSNDDVAESGGEGVELPPEIEAALARQLMTQLRHTLDEPIPMFRKKTLRELAKDPESRADAVSWLREQERLLRLNQQCANVDLRPLWDELGLEYQGLDTDPAP